jgi:glucosyl-3-phosphoglycerate phosphatase
LAAGRVVLIRHGESEWNAVGRWQGHSGVGLSPLGRRQAAATSDFVAKHEPDVRVVASSDLMRVTQTAEPAARALGLALQIDRRLREIDVGWWSGLTAAEIQERDPEAYAAYRAGQDVPRGGAETETQLRARVTAAVEDLRARCEDGTLLIFCHGGPVRALVGHALGMSVTAQRALAGPANCSRTVLAHRDGFVRLRCYNETAHLLACG